MICPECHASSLIAPYGEVSCILCAWRPEERDPLEVYEERLAELGQIDRDTEMVRLHREGWSYSAIGEEYGISRARVHQVVTGYRSPSQKRLRRCY